jgi:hypothetical protein
MPSPSEFVGTVRRECLDRMLIFHRGQLEGVINEFVDHYNVHRPHRALGPASPCAPVLAAREGERLAPTRLRRTDKLGGLIHEYRLVA